MFLSFSFKASSLSSLILVLAHVSHPPYVTTGNNGFIYFDFDILVRLLDSLVHIFVL